MKSRLKNLIQLHIGIVLFGFTALFGKFLSISPILVVCGRTFFAAITLFLFIIFSKQALSLSLKKDHLFLLSISIVYAIHWLTFFYSVQISSVAIGVLTFSTFPIFVTFMEPFFFKEKLRVIDILISIITFFGVLIIIPEFDLKNNFTQGALWGTVSGVTFAICILLNKVIIKKYSGEVISFYINVYCFFLLLPFTLLLKFSLSAKEIFLLFILGTIFTALSNTLVIKCLKGLNAQLVSITICLEPAYAIMFAGMILGEAPNQKTIVGGCIILAMAVFSTIQDVGLNSKLQRKH